MAREHVTVTGQASVLTMQSPHHLRVGEAKPNEMLAGAVCSLLQGAHMLPD
jgi:hypothetical protein